MRKTLGLLLIGIAATGCHPNQPVPAPSPQPPAMSSSSSTSYKHPLKMMQKGGASITSTVASAAEQGPNGLRVELYQLFPLLVHTVLFGGGYGGSAERAARKYAG